MLRTIPWARLTALYGAAIVLASISPGIGPSPDSTGPFGLLGADVWLHGVSFAVLGVMSMRSLRPRTIRTALTLLVGLIVMGGAIEVVQHWIPGRTTELSDALADGVGAAIGIVLPWSFRRYRERSRFTLPSASRNQ